MSALLAILVVLGAALALVHVRWRGRYGYPARYVPQTLCFHKVSKRFLFEGTWTTPKRFFAYVDRLRDRGWEFVDEARFLESLRNTPDLGDSKELLLTFDDGYGSLVDIAHGLRERNVSMHVFVLTDFVGKDNAWDLQLGRPAERHMSWDELRELMAAGHSIGSHGCSHSDLTTLSTEQIERELKDSMAAIDANLSVRARTFSYPFGRYNDAIKIAVREAGYDAAFSLYPRHGNDLVDRYALRRNGVYIIDPVTAIERKLERNRLYWIEETKCRAINGVARLTPMIKKHRD